MSNIIDISSGNCGQSGGQTINVNNCCDEGAYLFETQDFDMSVDTLPITANDDSTDIEIHVTSMSGDLDLTGNLPTNLNPGACIQVFNDTNSGNKIIFDNGNCIYKHPDKKGEFMTLCWNGSDWRVK